jgi:hypothetical protein
MAGEFVQIPAGLRYNSGRRAAGIPIAPKADAIAHLKKQFAIWGTWSTTATPTEVLVLSFFPNGTFLLAHDDDPSVAGGKDGIEWGSYRWNASTNGIEYNVIVDTDGTGGLSHPGSGPFSFVIDPSGSTAILHLGPSVGNEIHLNHAIDPLTSLVGGWEVEGLGMGVAAAVLTFSPDGIFTVANQGVDGAPDGIERGTYVYDAGTGNLTLTTTLDTNGDFGANDSSTLPSVSPLHAIIQSDGIGGGLDYLILESGPDRVFFHRIKAP